MRIGTAGVIGALVATAGFFPALLSAQEVPPGVTVSPMTRATLFVRNLDDSLKLYRDILVLKTRINRVERDRY